MQTSSPDPDQSGGLPSVMKWLTIGVAAFAGVGMGDSMGRMARDWVDGAPVDGAPPGVRAAQESQGPAANNNTR
jgi:hypothetical protein